MKSRVSSETMILVAICLADMLLTLYFVVFGAAVERNPIMAACLERSPELFVLVKTASFVPFVAAVELYRRRNPAFARSITRFAIALYVIAFTALTVHTNIM